MYVMCFSVAVKTQISLYHHPHKRENSQRLIKVYSEYVFCKEKATNHKATGQGTGCPWLAQIIAESE